MPDCFRFLVDRRLVSGLPFAPSLSSVNAAAEDDEEDDEEEEFEDNDEPTTPPAAPPASRLQPSPSPSPPAVSPSHTTIRACISCHGDETRARVCK
jgi:hypothetical protein